MSERYLSTLDLGTSKFALGVAKVSGSNAQVIYYKEAPADGVRYGCIYNPKKAANALRPLIGEAEEALGIQIQRLIVGYPRFNVRQEGARKRIERSTPSSLISEEEMRSLKDMALNDYPLEDPDHEIIYGAVAQSFSTDELFNVTEDDIVGTTGDFIEGYYKVFIGAKKASDNLDIMLNLLSIPPADKVFTPATTALAVLKADERMSGTALVEIGAGVTSVTICQQDILRCCASIPFGGSNVTKDIRHECAFSESLAENIKRAYGACLPDKLVSMGDKILQINDEENGGYAVLPVKYLSEIITERSREIIEAVLYLIQQSGYADKLRGGLVLTGGGARLTNLSAQFKELSGYHVRIGYPHTGAFSMDGCGSIGSLSGAASMGLLLDALAGPLNCMVDIPPVTSPQGPQPPAGPEQGGVADGGTVFDPPVPPVKPSGGAHTKGTGTRDKAPKGSRPPKENKIQWLIDTMGNLFGDTLGGIYDTMGQEDKNN
ncbi:MAG: rod shape-determining protein [Bacteroidales bacterium]|nr:rod shape-determining protein [Bacteroidales bacterium]